MKSNRTARKANQSIRRLVQKLRNSPTTIVSFNAHVGQGLKSGGLRWLLRRNPLTSLICVQEGRFVDHLARNIGRRFRRFPRSQPGANGVEAMTYVAWLKVRYKFVDGWNFNIRNGGQYPRKLTAALLYDKLSQRQILLVSIHADPMGLGWQAPDHIVKEHQKQMEEYYDFIAKVQAKHPGVRVVAAGDTNEVLSNDAPQKYERLSAKRGFKDLGLKPAHLGKLDGIWTSVGGSGHSVEVPTHGMDHPATVAKARL